MKSKALIFLLFFFLFSTLRAGEKHCLWQVQGQNNKLFLLGSVHMLTKAQYPLPAIFDSVYSVSDVLVFEVNIDSAQSPLVAAGMLQKGLLKGRKTLKTVLSDSVFNKVRKTLSRFGQPVEMYLKMKPWLLSLMLNQLRMRQLNFDPELGLEIYFWSRAKEDDKQVQTLESLNEQIALLEKLSLINPDHLLLETITEIDQAEKMMGQLIRAWQNGNGAKLDSLINVGLKAFPEVSKFLRVNRPCTP